MKPFRCGFVFTLAQSWRVHTWTLLILCLTACQHTPPPVTVDAASAIRAVIDRQASDWNNGNLAGFMEGYARGDETRFASGGSVTRGWQTVFDRYRTHYTDRAAMGTLAFSDLEITVLSADAAVAFGRWQLKREQDQPGGLFTLLFRRTDTGWRIVADHTSSADK